MIDSRTETGNTENETGVPAMQKKSKEVLLKIDGEMSKGTGANYKMLHMATPEALKKQND